MNVAYICDYGYGYKGGLLSWWPYLRLFCDISPRQLNLLLLLHLAEDLAADAPAVLCLDAADRILMFHNHALSAAGAAVAVLFLLTLEWMMARL